MRRLFAVFAVLSVAAAFPASPHAEDFCKGKTLTIGVGAPAGGIHDLIGRATCSSTRRR
jgi:hypothetical protein